MAKLPFSVFRRAGRWFFYVAFKNEKTGKYLPAISTKQETESGAVSTAFQWLRDGIPRNGETVPLERLESAACKYAGHDDGHGGRRNSGLEGAGSGKGLPLHPAFMEFSGRAQNHSVRRTYSASCFLPCLRFAKHYGRDFYFLKPCVQIRWPGKPLRCRDPIKRPRRGILPHKRIDLAQADADFFCDILLLKPLLFFLSHSFCFPLHL